MARRSFPGIAVRALRRAWIFGLGLLIGGGFYLLLVDITDLPELYVLAGVAVACGVLFSRSREQGFVEARISLGWVLSGWRVALRIPLDVVLLCRDALAQLIAPRASRGSFRAVRFEAVGDSPDEVGRRAVTEWLGSAAPNTLVVGVDPDRRLLLVHQLHHQGGAEQIDPLRLG